MKYVSRIVKIDFLAKLRLHDGLICTNVPEYFIEAEGALRKGPGHVCHSRLLRVGSMGRLRGMQRKPMVPQMACIVHTRGWATSKG